MDATATSIAIRYWPLWFSTLRLRHSLQIIITVQPLSPRESAVARAMWHDFSEFILVLFLYTNKRLKNQPTI